VTSQLKATWNGQEEGEDPRIFLYLTWDNLPVHGGLILTQVRVSEDEVIKEKLLNKVINMLAPFTQDVIVAEGEAFLKGADEMLSKLTWLGPELAEDYA
jgi:hypothetical protein